MRRKSTEEKLVSLCDKIMSRLARDTLKSCRAGSITPKDILKVIDALERHRAFMKRWRHPEPESGSAIDDIRKRLGKARAPSEPAGSQ